MTVVQVSEERIGAMTGGQLFVDTLEKLHVEYIFGTPGTTETAMLDAVAGSSQIKYVLALHEGVAAGMADGYARVSGQPGVVNVHSSVGTANIVASLNNAWRDGIPMVVCIGHKDSHTHNRDCFCGVPDFLGIVRQFAKGSWQVMYPEQVGEDLARAFRLAATPPQGPVCLVLPENILAADVSDPETGWCFSQGTQVVSHATQNVTGVVKLLSEAKRPLLLAGSEIGRQKALDDVVRLSETLSIPVMQESFHELTDVSFPTTHPNYLGTLGINKVPYTPDVVLAIGNKFLEFHRGEFDPVLKGTSIITVSEEPWNALKLAYPVAISLVGHVKTIMGSIVESVEEADLSVTRQEWQSLMMRETRAVRVKEAEMARNVSPLLGILNGIRDTLKKDPIVVNECTTSVRQIFQGYEFYEGGTYLHTAGGALGWGLPAALGIKVAFPKRYVIAAMGDGATMFNPQALWTAAHYNIPIIILVAHNSGYRVIKESLKRFSGFAAKNSVFPGSPIDHPVIDFVALAHSMGVKGVRVSDPAEALFHVEIFMKEQVPLLLEVPMD